MIKLKKDLEKYLVKDFEPLNNYIDSLNQRIQTKINDDIENNGAVFEYLDIDNKKIKVYINIINDGDIYISFYLYNELLEVTEMVDFLLKINTDISVIRYSAIFYENDVAKIVNSGYTYQNNDIIKGWKNKYIIDEKAGRLLATCDNLANLGCHIENDNMIQLNHLKMIK